MRSKHPLLLLVPQHEAAVEMHAPGTEVAAHVRSSEGNCQQHQALPAHLAPLATTVGSDYLRTQLPGLPTEWHH